jgi:hypothetical protein
VVTAGLVLLLALFAFGPRAMAAPLIAAYHAVLRAVGLEVPAKTSTIPSPPAASLQPPKPTPAPQIEVPPQPAPAAQVVASAPRKRRAQPDPLHAEYLRAHQAQFVAQDYETALQAWDAYIAHASAGTFALEARYNRAIALAHVGRIAEAREALAPFAAGEFGDYRRRAAQRLLDVLPH